MGIYAAISGAQLVMLQINFTCVVTFGIRAGRWVVQAYINKRGGYLSVQFFFLFFYPCHC